MTNDDVLFGYRLQLVRSGRPHHGRQRLPDLRGASLDLLPLEAPGRPPRAWRCCARGAAPPADAEPAFPRDGRGADPGLRDRQSGPRPTSARRRARTPQVGRAASSRQTGSGGCFAATGSTPAPSAWPWWPATERPIELPREPEPEPQDRELVDPASWSASTASSSGAARHPGRRLAADRHATPTRPSAGPSSSSARQGNPTEAQTSPLCPARRRGPRAALVGAWSASSPTTATSSTAPASPPSVERARGDARPGSTPGRPQTNGHVERCTGRSSRSAGGPAFARYL